MKKNTGRYLLATDELTCQHSAGRKKEFTVLSVFPLDQKSNSVRTSFSKSDSAIEILFFPGARSEGPRRRLCQVDPLLPHFLQDFLTLFLRARRLGDDNQATHLHKDEQVRKGGGGVGERRRRRRSRVGLLYAMLGCRQKRGRERKGALSLAHGYMMRVRCRQEVPFLLSSSLFLPS